MSTLNVPFNFYYMLQNNDWPFGDLYCKLNQFISLHGHHSPTQASAGQASHAGRRGCHLGSQFDHQFPEHDLLHRGHVTHIILTLSYRRKRVVVIFAVCWLPMHIYFLVTTYYPETTLYRHIQELYLIIYWLAMSILKMPVNLFETKKGVEKAKFSLSLIKNNATYLSNENGQLEVKENSIPAKFSNNNNKENKPVKRPFKSTYHNTLNSAKKLKPLSESTKPPVPSTAMLNGHHNNDNQYGTQRKIPIATLYAPRFLHNLHHLVNDLTSVEQKLGSIRLKSSSLGRSASGLASSGARSWSNKDLLSLGQSDTSAEKSKIRAAESKCFNSSSTDASPEPFAADAFLTALQDVNPTFEGNRQQDAHELLVCILDNIRETCRALADRARLHVPENGDSNGIARQPSLDDSKPTLGNLRKSWKKRKETKASEKRHSPTEERAPSPADPEREERARPGWDFVADDFEDSCGGEFKCEREGSGDATATTGSSFMRTLFNRPRPPTNGCGAKECCVPRPRPEASWLACDDEQVKPISNEEFEDLLSAEPKMRSAATPYLLFYVKSEVG
ncbi:hypothetical protein MSG28_002673 [Choristoneura fumiferana]|uniref:Uncharacterized protein n=1 Tax=Choristoneura fumiferana TaxID=7141 RepID=A0ACC0JIW1_CHOFU|nr:hypothetical protein MSG28_002673 [Choristoneura fumiferana]